MNTDQDIANSGNEDNGLGLPAQKDARQSSDSLAESLAETDTATSTTSGHSTGADGQPGFCEAEGQDPLLGTWLDNRYLIQEVIGSGGMSVVYKARQEAVDRTVAIKSLHLNLQSRSVVVERFQREMKTLCILNHPNIVAVYDVVLGANHQPCVVMDFLNGTNLEELLRKEKRLDWQRALNIFVQMCKAVEHAHKNDVIHRDLKPGNIMLVGEDDWVKVVDFGLAKLGEDNQKLTNTGEIWGSPPYMSPEQEALLAINVPIFIRSGRLCMKSYAAKIRSLMPTLFTTSFRNIFMPHPFLSRSLILISRYLHCLSE